MYNCLIIFGESNSGKSYTADLINKKFNIKTIHFDFLISLVCESIRNYFEKKKFENKEIIWYTNGLSISNDELSSLLNDWNKIIEQNSIFFENLYFKSIKGTRPSWSYQPDIDKPKDVVNLGKLGQLLNHFGSTIIDLIFVYIIKNSHDFVIEGIYFSSGTNFLKKLESSCKKISYLRTQYNKETKSYTYEYDTKDAKSVDEIITKLKDNLFFGSQ